jgi:hypothetical protein
VPSDQDLPHHDLVQTANCESLAHYIPRCYPNNFLSLSLTHFLPARIPFLSFVATSNQFRYSRRFQTNPVSTKVALIFLACSQHPCTQGLFIVPEITQVLNHALYSASRKAVTIAPTICGPTALELPKPERTSSAFREITRATGNRPERGLCRCGVARTV